MSTQWGRPAGWLLLGIGVMLLASGTGCAAAIISSTGTEESALFLPKSRAEVIERFGQPDKEETLPEDGLTIDTYRLRKKLRESSASYKLLDWCNHVNCGEGLLLWPVLTIATYGAPEVILAGVDLYESVHNGYHIAFVYDPEDQIVLRYLLNDLPADLFAEGWHQLDQRLWDDLERNSAPLAPSIDRYGTDLRLWAQHVEHPVPPETQEALQLTLQLARDADEGRLSREEVISWLKTPSAYNPLR